MLDASTCSSSELSGGLCSHREGERGDSVLVAAFLYLAALLCVLFGVWGERDTRTTIG